jgi:hypothetical protein
MRTYTMALTPFSTVGGARQKALYMLLCQAKSMEFRNLKHLPGSGIRKQNSMNRSITTLTGPAHQTFSRCRCSVSGLPVSIRVVWMGTR